MNEVLSFVSVVRQRIGGQFNPSYRDALCIKMPFRKQIAEVPVELKKQERIQGARGCRVFPYLSPQTEDIRVEVREYAAGWPN